MGSVLVHFLCTAIVLVMLTVPTASAQTSSPQKTRPFAEWAAISFDPRQTIRVFAKTEKGGIQQVIVKDPLNSEQIALVRGYLADLSRAIQQGGFPASRRIDARPAAPVARLPKTVRGTVQITFRELPQGAEIQYSADHADVIARIHRWFDAQISDQGDDADRLN